MAKRKREKGLHPATPRAIVPPEILGMIFHCLIGLRVTHWKCTGIQSDRQGRVSVPAIYACLLVNSIWFHEAVRLLWQHPTAANKYSLARCFQNIHQSRRQFYANLVRKSNLVDHCPHMAFTPGNARKYIDALYGLTFPQIHSLDVIIDVAQCGKGIPWIYAPTVTRLSIYFYSYCPMPIHAGGTLPYYLSQKSEQKVSHFLVCLTKNRFPAVKWVFFECQRVPSQFIECLTLKLPAVHITTDIQAMKPMLQQKISMGQI